MSHPMLQGGGSHSTTHSSSSRDADVAVVQSIAPPGTRIMTGSKVEQGWCFANAGERPVRVLLQVRRGRRAAAVVVLRLGALLLAAS